MNDMGPYAAAVARLFGSGQLQSLAAIEAPQTRDCYVDLGFSLLAGFSGGVRYSGHFSFEGEYQNRMRLIGKGGSLDVDRVFSPPQDFKPLWQIRKNSQSTERQMPAGDTFGIFMIEVLRAIQAGDYDRFADELIADAYFRSRLAAALKDNSFG